MEIIINNNDKSEQFITIFQNIKLYCDHFNIILDNEKFYIQGMDPSHISIFEINLTKEWFDVYNIDKNVTMGLSSNIFSKILTAWSLNHSIKLYIEKEDHLNISFEKIADKSTEYNKYFEIPLMDIDSEHLSVPEQEYTLDIEFDSKKFKKIVDELSLIGERVNIKCNENEINAICESLEANMKINIPFDDIESYSIEEHETIDNTFSLKFIKNMCMYSKLTSLMFIHITEGQPLQIKYTLENNSYVRFYLAPTIDDN